METLVLILMIVVCFNFILKQTFQKTSSAAVIVVFIALFTGLMWPYAIEFSKTQIAVWLSDSALMLDISVIMSLEVILQISFCILSAHIASTGIISKKELWTYKILRLFPGILILPIIFSILIKVIFLFPGISFSLIAWSLAVIVAVSIPLFRFLLLYILPEKEIRLELLFLANALIILLGILVTVNGRTAIKGMNEVNWYSFAGVIAMVITGIIAGHYIRKFKINKKS